MVAQATVGAERQSRLLEELMTACRNTPAAELTKWSKASAHLFLMVLIRRGKNLGQVAKSLLKWIATEAWRAKQAVGTNAGGQYAKDLGDRAAGGVATAFSRTVYEAFTINPSERAPKLLIGALAAFAASGGPDANGGAPDLDLAFGIDAHRSILTHSVIAGAVIETSLVSLANLVGVVYRNMPPDSDPLWQRIHERKNEFVEAAHRGASVGIAYHLGVDATIQEGSYHDIGVPLSQAGHSGIAGANAAAELIDAAKRGPLPRPHVPVVSKESVKEAAGKVADYAKYGALVSGAFLSGLFGGSKMRSK